MAEILSFKVNGQKREIAVNQQQSLLDVLRQELGLKAAKRGCDTGDCGACTILMDGEPVNACLVLALEAEGCEISTAESIRHPIQETFAELGSFQCGYCAPGILVSSCSLLKKTPNPEDQEIKDALSGHLCRCTGYRRILMALKGETEEHPQDENFQVIGRPVVRKDIREKISGQAQYTGDLWFPGMVWGAVVPSPVIHGRVKNIDVSEALAMEGVVLALLPEDVPDTLYGVSPARYDENILPKDVVRHLGEPVAAIFAETRTLAEEAAAKVKLDIEPIEAVLDAHRAMEKDAPQIHDRFKGNVNTEIHQDFGDVEDVFAKAHLVREDTFSGHRTHQAFLEPHASLAMVEEDVINLWTSSQTPHYTRYHVARALGFPESKLRVIKGAMGGGFGGKAEATKLDMLSILAAQKLKRPVMMLFDRKQVFYQGRGRHGQEISLKTAFDKEGRILGLHEDVIMDGGAYTSYGIITAYYSGSLTTTPYRIPNFRFDNRRMVTNLPACGAQRGNGTPYPRFAFESQIDMAALDLGLDPLTIRARNLLEPGEVTVNGLQITSCGIKECLEEVDQLSDFRNKWNKMKYGRGIGIGLGCFISGAGSPIVRGDLPHSACTIRIDEDGQRAYLYTGAPEIGQGSDTILCQMAAEVLGLTYEQVSIISSDSAVTPKELGAYASRITFMAGNATVQAATFARDQLSASWGDLVGRPAEGSLQFRLGQVSDGKESRSLEELVRFHTRNHGPVSATGSYTPPESGGKHKGAAVGTSPAYSFCAVTAEVKVDLETGKVEVERFCAAHDSGTVINPVTFHGQVEGALVMGMGETLTEQIVFKKGVMRNPGFHDYLIPTIADTPEIIASVVPVSDPNGPFGAKEVGEGTILPVMGAIANAVADAVGVRVMDLPISPEKVLNGMRENGEKPC